MTYQIFRACHLPTAFVEALQVAGSRSLSDKVEFRMGVQQACYAAGNGRPDDVAGILHPGPDGIVITAQDVAKHVNSYDRERWSKEVPT